MNPMETLRELWAGIVYMVQRWRGNETDKQARRMAAHQGVFGHSRSRPLTDGSVQSESLICGGREKMREKKGPSPLSAVDSVRLDEVLVGVEREIYLDSERQWLGSGHVQDYVLGGVTREKSEGFEDQVVRELYRRGYTLRGDAVPCPSTVDTTLTPIIEASRHNKGRSVSRKVDVGEGHVRRDSHRRSWWQTIYQRVSQSGEGDDQEKHLSPHPKRKSVSRPKDSAQALPLIQEMPIGSAGYTYEDPPPLSMLDAYHSSWPTDDERKIPRDAAFRPSPPTSNVGHRFPEPMGPNVNPHIQLGRSDSLLDRVFAFFENDVQAVNTELDHGMESQPSRPTSLWRVGSANVVPRHNEERSSLTQANISDGVYPQLVTPVRGDVFGVDTDQSQDEKLPTPPPRRSHIRETAGYSMSSPCSPPLQLSLPAVGDNPLANPLPPLQPPGIPDPSAEYDRSFPLPSFRMGLDSRSHVPEQAQPAYVRVVRPLQIPDPQSRLSQQHPTPGPSSPPDPARRHPATRDEALLRPFPEPVHHPPPDVGPARFTPPRSKLTIPAPLAQPLPRGSGSMKRNKMNSLPPFEQCDFVCGGPYREPPNRSRRHSQPIPTPRHRTDPNHVAHLPNPSPKNPHRRTLQPPSVLQGASHSDMSAPHRQSRRLSSPPLSALPLGRPSRSNAIYRKPQSPGSRSPVRVTSPRASLLSDLRSAPPMDSTGFTRYPVPRPGSGISSPPRNSRTSVPPSPGTPTFVNTHMLPPLTSSPRSDVEEWASAVSSFSPSVSTKRP